MPHDFDDLRVGKLLTKVLGEFFTPLVNLTALLSGKAMILSELFKQVVISFVCYIH